MAPAQLRFRKQETPRPVPLISFSGSPGMVNTYQNMTAARFMPDGRKKRPYELREGSGLVIFRGVLVVQRSTLT